MRNTNKLVSLRAGCPDEEVVNGKLLLLRTFWTAIKNEVRNFNNKILRNAGTF